MIVDNSLKIQKRFWEVIPGGCHTCANKEPSQPFRTLFLQETMKRGLLMPSSIVSCAHSDKDVEQTVERISEALVVYKKALEEGIDKYMVGNPVKPVFRKYNS